jgi:hypothetical protein
MATPTKEELKDQRELKEYLKTLSKDSEVFTGLTAGLGFVGRGVSTVNKVSKIVKNSKRGKDVFNQLASKLKSFQSTAKKGGKKTKSTVKEVVEKKPAIPTNIPSTMELAQIPGSSVKTIKEGVKSFKGTKDTFTPRNTERVAKAREILNQPIAGNMRPSTISQGFKSPFANTSLRPYINTKGNPFDFNKFKLDGDVINKPLANVIEGAALVGKGAMVTGGLGVGSALFSSDNRISSPVDLKRIDKSKLKDSNIEGVKTIRGSDGKDYGIKWNNTTKSWDYYRGGGKPVVKQTNPKQEKSGLAIGGGDSKRNDSSGTGSGGNQRTTTGSGTTKPRSATGQAFDKAFAEARKQAGGAGGIFEFNNKKYGTALEGETVPKNRVEVGKTTAPVTIKNDYPTAKTDPTLEIAMQQDSIRQQMATKPLPTKPLSSLVFKTTAKAAETQKMRNTMDEQNALRSIIADNRMPLKKKRYGGNLAMLKYMKQ